MWAAGKAVEEAAGAVPWEGDWETIASIQETVCHSGAQVERVGQEDEIQLLWAWAHGITTEFLPWNRCLTLRNGWEGEHLSGFSEPPTCPGCKVWGYISSRYMEGWRPQYRGWWDYAWDTLLSPLCERKTNAGGSNETGALEAGVALKGAVLPLKTSPGLNQCLLLFFFSLCSCAHCEFCFSTNEEHPGWRQQSWWGRGGTISRVLSYCMAWSIFHHHLSCKRYWRWPVWPRQANCSWRGSGHVSGHTAAVWCGAGTTHRKGECGFWLQCWHQDQQIQVVPWVVLAGNEPASNSWGWKSILVGKNTGKRSPEWFSR